MVDLYIVMYKLTWGIFRWMRGWKTEELRMTFGSWFWVNRENFLRKGS